MPNPKQAGRPRDTTIDQSLLRVTEALLSEHGYSGVSVESICREARCTRRTFYLRFGGLDEIVLEVLRHRYGVNVPEPAGSLTSQLEDMQRREIAMFSDTLFRKSLPGLLEAIRRNPELRSRYAELFVAPRRQVVADLLEAAVERGEIPGGTRDVPWICDLLLGPILARAVIPGTGALDDGLVHRTVSVVLRELGRKPPQT